MPQKFEFQREITKGPIDMMTADGDTEQVILGLYLVEKHFNGQSKTTQFVTVGNTPSGVFKDSNVRMYVPLKGVYYPSDEEIIALFKGESVFIKDLPKKDGSTYSASFIFDPWQERSFIDRFGKKRVPNFTGDLKFAPKKKKEVDNSEDFW